MFQNLDVLRTAMAMARHAGEKQAVSAQNIANADTPGYRAKDLPAFADTLRADLTDQRATRSGHLNGQMDRAIATTERRDAQDPNGNTVSLELEMIEAVEAKRQSDQALAIYRNGLSVIRASIGRN